MSLLEFILIILVILWLTGTGFHIGGELINILIVVALVLFIWNLFNRTRRP